MRKRLFVFAATTCFALSTFATPALAEVTSLEDAQTISSDAQENDSDAPADAPVQPDEDVQEDVPINSGDALPGSSDDASTARQQRTRTMQRPMQALTARNWLQMAARTAW